MPEPAKSDTKKGTPSKDTTHDDLLERVILQHEDINKVLLALTEIAKHSFTAPQISTQYYNKDLQTITAAGPNPPCRNKLQSKRSGL